MLPKYRKNINIENQLVLRSNIDVITSHVRASGSMDNTPPFEFSSNYQIPSGYYNIFLNDATLYNVHLNGTGVPGNYISSRYDLIFHDE